MRTRPQVPSTQVKKQVSVVASHGMNTRWLARLAGLVSSGFKWQSLLQCMRWGATEEDTRHQPLGFTCIHTYIHVCAPVHMWEHSWETYTHMHTHMYIHTRAYTCTYAHMHRHMHTHSHEHTLLTFYMFTFFHLYDGAQEIHNQKKTHFEIWVSIFSQAIHM